MGTVMLAAFLEWFLWLAAFLYCLIKVFVKAEHWSIRILAAVMMIGFSALRLVRVRPAKENAVDFQTDLFSSRSWLLRSLSRRELPNITLKGWYPSCSGLHSGLSQVFSLFPGCFAFTSLSPTPLAERRESRPCWMRLRRQRPS